MNKGPLMMEYFDTHTHYAIPEYEPFLEEVLSGIKAARVTEVMLVGTDTASSERVCRMAEKYRGAPAGDRLPRIYTSIGLHPGYIPKDAPGKPQSSVASLDPEAIMGELAELIEKYHPDALGEFGLERPAGKTGNESVEYERQRLFFSLQMELCERYGLPGVIHSQNAAGDTLEMIKAHPGVRGVIHGFSGSAESALEYCRRGWYLGIGTTLCKKGIKKLKEVVLASPIDRLLLETDCPYRRIEGVKSVVPGLADSLQLVSIAERIALIRGLGVGEIAGILRENAHACFGIGRQGEN